MWLLIDDDQTNVFTEPYYSVYVSKNEVLECVHLFLAHHAIILYTKGPSGADSCAGNRSDVKHEHEEWWWSGVECETNVCAQQYCRCLMHSYTYWHTVESAKPMRSNKYFISLRNVFLNLYFTIKLLWLLYMLFYVLWSYCYFAFFPFYKALSKIVKKNAMHYSLLWEHFINKIMTRNLITFS